MTTSDNTPTSVPALKPLTPADRVEEEMVIGGFPFSEAETTAAIDVPSRERLLKGTQLSVLTPSGGQITDPALVRQIDTELEQLLGGWFTGDLEDHIELYDSLVSLQTREYYQSGGMTIQWDEPSEAFYYLAFQVSPWQVQVVGEPGVFHAVFLGHLLTQSEAIGPGGHPRVHPVGAIEPVLAQAVPNIAQRSLVDETDQHAQNVFDTYLVDSGLVVKSGVRMRLAEGGIMAPAEQNHFYGIRINVDLRQK